MPFTPRSLLRGGQPTNAEANRFTASLREKALAEVTDALARDRCGTVRRLAEAWPDGRIKLAVIATLLE
jgi:hypothetical protein